MIFQYSTLQHLPEFPAKPSLLFIFGCIAKVLGFVMP